MTPLYHQAVRHVRPCHRQKRPSVARVHRFLDGEEDGLTQIAIYALTNTRVQPTNLHSPGLSFLGRSSKVLFSADRLWVKVRPLADTDRPGSGPGNLVDVVGRGMEGGAVVPDCQRVLFPSEPDLELVVRGDMVPEELQHLVRLGLGELVDPLGEALVDKQTFPPCDGVRSDHRVYGRQMLSDIVGRTPGLPDLGT